MGMILGASWLPSCETTDYVFKQNTMLNSLRRKGPVLKSLRKEGTDD